MTEPNAPHPQASVPNYRVPTSMELYAFFNEFLVRWANLTGDHVSWGSETVLPMGLEEGILFSEPAQGLLVIRATENFRRYLLDEFERKQKGASSGKGEIFIEMTVLFWHLFAKKFLQLDSRRMAPVVLRTSLPRDWPDREPQASALITVKGNQIELRFWIDINSEDIARFRRK